MGDISESEEKESAQNKAPDSFINDIYESEGRQSLPEEDIEVSVPEAKSENTAPDSFINDIYTSEGKQAVPEKIEMKENISSNEKVIEVIISESEKSEENVKSSDELEEHQNDEKTTSLEKESDNDEGMEKPSNDTVSISVDMKTREKSQETNLLNNLSSPKDKDKFAPGVLELTVERASQLVNNDKIGKSDPYVKITYRDEEFRSKTIKNTLEPEWNFSCEIDIPDQEEKYIHINVYDDDFGKENFIGCYSLSVTEAISDIPKDGKWYSLVGCKTGKVSFSTFYSPDDDQEEKDKETEKCNEKEIDQINKKEDMSLDNTQEEPKSVDKELPERKEKEEDKTDSTVTTVKDKELSSKASDKDIKELEIEPDIKAAETNDEKEQSESSSDDHSESSDSSEQSKDDQKEVTDKEGIHTDKGSIESEKEKGSDDKDTAPDSFINEIYTSEGRQASPIEESEEVEIKE